MWGIVLLLLMFLVLENKYVLHNLAYMTQAWVYCGEWYVLSQWYMWFPLMWKLFCDRSQLIVGIMSWFFWFWCSNEIAAFWHSHHLGNLYMQTDSKCAFVGHGELLFPLPCYWSGEISWHFVTLIFFRIFPCSWYAFYVSESITAQISTMLNLALTLVFYKG